MDPLNLASAHLYLGESLLDEGRVTEAAGPGNCDAPVCSYLGSCRPQRRRRNFRALFARYGTLCAAEAVLLQAREPRIAL